MTEGNCPKCNSQLITDHGRLYCLMCGTSPMSKKESMAWYSTNNEEMRKDLAENGSKFVIDKWKIKPQVISHLKSKRRAKVPARPVAPSASNGLPPLPVFSDNWSENVQLKWLEIWEQRRRSE